MTSPNTAVDHVLESWKWFTEDRRRNAHLNAPTQSRATDGGLMVSFRVHGPDAARALETFAGLPEYLRPIGADDLRPVFDYSVPDRVACLWRTAGVWVELWHPETMTAAPAPVPVPVGRSRGLLGGRLPFTRTRRKETAA